MIDAFSAAIGRIDARLQRIGGARTVRLTAIVAFAACVAYVAILAFVLADPFLARRGAGPLLLAASAGAGLGLLRRNRIALAYLALLIGTWLSIALSAALVAGLRTTLTLALPVVAMAAWPLGRRSVIGIGAASILLLIGLGLAEWLGVTPAPLPTPLALLALSHPLILLVAMAFTTTTVSEQDRSLEGELRLREELAARAQRLADQARELRVITDTVPAMICVYDGLVCRFANPRYAAFFGFAPEAVVGLHLREVIGAEAFEHAHPIVERVLGGEQITYVGRRASPTQGGRVLEITLVPDRLGPEGARGFFGLFVDITERTDAEAEVRRLNAELEHRVRERTAELQAANRELESFAYSISHDLRAPLRGIDGFSKLLADEYRERLDQQGVDYLERVRRAAQRMGTLIDDILELSRVSRLEMRRAAVDLSLAVAEIVDERVRVYAGPPPRVTVQQNCGAVGDPQLLRILLQNLIENAWKYSSREAAPSIEFGSYADKGDVVYFVRDNGVGFDMQYADRLFTPFQRLHRPEEFEGTGIGLATVARVVHRHGGRIWAEAAPGKGATFRFTLLDQPR